MFLVNGRFLQVYWWGYTFVLNYKGVSELARKEVHTNTSPENAGEQNMTPENLSTVKTKYDVLNGKCLNRVIAMKAVRQPYKGEWTEPEFKKSVDEFFEYCAREFIEPSKPLLAIWLDCRKETIWSWSTHPDTGYKYEILSKAFNEMESIYFQKLDDSPVPSMFKLKTNNFGYCEAQKVDITTNGNDISDSESVKKLVDKMGLDKKTD